MDLVKVQYLDLLLALASVNPMLLPFNLGSLNIVPLFTECFDDYVHNRRFYVRLDAALSSPARACNGGAEIKLPNIYWLTKQTL